jgi:hypothetical protein
MTTNRKDLVAASGSASTDATAYQLLRNEETNATAVESSAKKAKKTQQKTTEAAPDPSLATSATVRLHTSRVSSIDELLDDSPSNSWCCGLFGKSAPKPTTAVTAQPTQPGHANKTPGLGGRS